ncbi:MAG: amidase domain-containing protein [Caldisericia bacterium]
MLRKILSIAVVAILLLSMGVTLAFAGNSEEEVLKHQADAKDGQIVGSVPAEGMTSEGISELDKNFDLQEKQARKDDDIVSDIIFKITKDKGMKSKASNVAKDGRVEVMRYIISYIEAGNEKNLNTVEMARLVSYVQSYGPYSDDATILEYLGKEKRTLSSSLSYSYTPSAAINYAHTYYNTFNTPTYPNMEGMGGDCANFVSQALKAGGMSTDGQWFIIRKNTTYPRPTNVTELNYSWMLADPSPWISAKEFNNYWSNRRYGYTYTATGAYVYSH